MSTFMHIRPYLAQVFSEWEIFPTEFVEKVKKHILFQYLFFLNRTDYK